MTPGLFEHHTLILLDTEKFFFFFLPFKQPFLLLAVLAVSKTGSSDGELCRRIITWCAGGEGISLDLITSWLYQLSTGPLFKCSR